MTRHKRKHFRNLLTIVAPLLFVGLALAWAKAPSARTSRAPQRLSSAVHGQSAEAGASQASTGKSIHLALGVPTDSNASDEYIIDHGTYVLSYNPAKNVPNWVSWALDRSYLGHVRRKNNFRSDPLLPSQYYHVTPQDYHGSGYDRGHLCPSADREDSPDDNSLTFLMTNIQPQLHELNGGPWEKLEEHERELARQRNAELFIIAGGIFNAHYRSIGHGVAVPKANYKIIVALRQGQGAANLKSDTEVIAVIMPNEAGVGKQPWTDYLTSVDAIEMATGYDYLSKVPKSVQDVLEGKVAVPQ